MVRASKKDYVKLLRKHISHLGTTLLLGRKLRIMLRLRLLQEVHPKGL